jgi:hypothetical protein
MPHVVFCVLMSIVSYGGFAAIHQIAAISGYEPSYILAVMVGMKKREWVYKPSSQLFAIGERGKIALAIEVGIRRRASAHRTFRRRVPIKGFVSEARVRKWTGRCSS